MHACIKIQKKKIRKNGGEKLWKNEERETDKLIKTKKKRGTARVTTMIRLSD